jgi:hypothetical protein
MGFRRWPITRIVAPGPRVLATPLAVAYILGASGERGPPPPWVGLVSCALVDVERSPYLGVVLELSSANSNTRVPSLIRPYPLHQKLFHNNPPVSLSGVYLTLSSRKKTSGRPERKILVVVENNLTSPLYWGFLTTADHVDHIRQIHPA